MVGTDHVHETGLARSLRRARGESPDRPARAEPRQALAQAYRFLLTRGIYGVYLWFEDEETREALRFDASESRRPAGGFFSAASPAAPRRDPARAAVPVWNA